MRIGTKELARADSIQQLDRFVDGVEAYFHELRRGHSAEQGDIRTPSRRHYDHGLTHSG